jgi:hypothetical protein
MSILEIMRVMGILLRVFGALVFGLGAGWLVLQVLKWQLWQLATAAVLGLLGTFALLGHWTSGAGTLGAFGLGAGAGLLIWGMMEERNPEPSQAARRARK